MAVELELERLRDVGSDEFLVVADAMPQLVWAANASGRIVYVNRQWVEYTGLTAEAIGAAAGSVGVVHPDDVELTWARWRAALANGSPYEIEYRLRRVSDGAYRWFLSRAVPMRGVDGSIGGWIGTATDIDDQRRLRDRLSFVVAAGAVLRAARSVEAVCNALTNVAVERIADWCFVVLADGDRLRTAAVAHANGELLHDVERFRDRYPVRAEDPVARVVAANAPLLIESVEPEYLEASAYDAEHLAFLRGLGVRSGMVVPIAAPDGGAIGALGLMTSDSERSFDGADLEAAATVAQHAGATISDLLSRSLQRDAIKGLRFVGRVNEVLLETDDLRMAVAHIAQAVTEEIADACAVLRSSNDAVRIQLLEHRDVRLSEALGGLRGQRPLRPVAERHLAQRVRAHRTIVFDAEENALIKASTWPHHAEAFAALEAKTTVIVPLFWGTTTYGALAAYFSQQHYDAERDVPLLEEAAARVSVAIEKSEILERERRIGATLQQALLPTLIPQPPGLHFDAVYAPATGEGAVGGDWYDAIELDDGSVVISVGDVTGRGVEAAAIMSKVRHAMGMAPLHQRDPARVLDSAEWFLRKRYPDALVTAFVGVIDPERGSLDFASAGHPRPILRRGGTLAELASGGLPLGLRRVAEHERSKVAELRAGDVIVLYTDGLTEWSRATAEGERRLEAIIGNEVMTVTRTPARVIERACVPADAPDDVAILTVSIGNEPLWSYVSEDARVAAHARGEFVQFLREQEACEELIGSAELVFGELLGNVVRHAPGPVEIALFCKGGQWMLHVIDWGEPFEPQDRLPDDPLSELGRGLFIIARLAKHVRLNPIPNYGNHVVVTL